MAENEGIRTKIEAGIAVITLDRPPVNALSPALVGEIDRAFREAEKDPTVRAVVVNASGTEAFSAGADLNELRKLSPKDAERVILLGQETFSRFEASGVPVLCAINGLALGGGLELALACDVRIASDRSRFGFPEVSLGLIPAWGGTQRAARLLGPAKARELIFTGAWINAQEALRIGLVNRVVPDGEESRAAMEMARVISVKCAPLAVAAAKRAIREGEGIPLADALKTEIAAMQRLAVTEDLREGITAVQERRQPRFKGA